MYKNWKKGQPQPFIFLLFSWRIRTVSCEDSSWIPKGYWALEVRRALTGVIEYCYMFFFYKQSKFRKQARACLWKNLIQAQSMLALCLFIKILLGVCLRKRLDQARNMIILEKLLYKMCCWCDTTCNIIGHLFWAPFILLHFYDESEVKCFAILNTKNHSQYGKIHATQKNA